MSKQPNRKPKSSRARKRRLAQKQANALNFEMLEARHLLASVTVGNATDVLSSSADTSSITALIAANGGDGISLREAITAANKTPGADTITFAPSVFVGGVSSLIRLGGTELTVTDALTIDGSTGTDVTITADALGDDVTNGAFITDVSASFGGTAGAADDLLDDNSRVLNFSSSTGDLTLEGLTLTGGRTVELVEKGGGIRFDSGGSVLLTNSTVSGNSTFGDGADGGGIHANSVAVSLTNSTVSGNSTAGNNAEGGGIHASSGDVLLTSTVVSGNSTFGDFAEGGGICSDAGDVSLTRSTVSGNGTFGQSGWGGGIFARYLGAVSLTNSTVSGNSTFDIAAYGGGIFADAGAVALTSSTVSGNSTFGDRADGGGIFTLYGSVTLTSSTVSGNAAGGSGGGIYVRNSSATPSLTIENSIVAGNRDNGGKPNDLVPDPDSPLTINDSLIGVADNLGTISGNVGNQTGAAAMPLDPLLGPLAFNGGPTKTHALLPGSPAIDAGNNTTDTEDQRGSMRVVDLPGVANAATSNGADIGAFERRMTEPFTDPPVVTSIVRDEGGVLARPDRLRTFVVTFNRDVNVVAKDLIVRNDTTLGTVVDTSGVGFSYDSPSQTARWNFNSLPNLDAAFYSFELSDDIVSVAGNLSLDGDADGNPGIGYIESIYVAVPGDANLDGQVNVLGDAFILVGNLGTTNGATWAQGDFNGNGNVNVLGDAFVLVGNLGQDVRPPAAAASVLSVSSVAAVTIQSQTVSTATSSPAPVALLMETSSDADDELAIANEGNLTTPQSESPQLVLAGDHELRDDVFGSDF